jgi:hypothetical protein
MRKWLRISKFRNTALNFLTAPESERLRKRNMAFREIVCTERVRTRIRLSSLPGVLWHLLFVARSPLFHFVCVISALLAPFSPVTCTNRFHAQHVNKKGYVNNLEELEKRIISPLKASSHGFISEKEVGVLFSNLESITCLNIQVRTTIWEGGGGGEDRGSLSVGHIYTQILELMEERIEQWPREGRFADIFIEKAPVLRLYTDYLNNYDRQVRLFSLPPPS